MRLKTKLFVPLFVILVMTMATSAFGQIACSVNSPTPTARTIITGHSEPAGDLVFSCTGGVGASAAANITVYYGVPITNNLTTSTAAAGPGVRVTAVSGFANDNSIRVISGGAFTGAARNGFVTIQIPAFAAATAPPTGSFTLRGVMLGLAGATSGTGVKASLAAVSSDNNVTITGSDTPTVVTASLPGINTTTAPPALTVNTLPALFGGSGTTISASRSMFSATVTENYIDAFRSLGQETTYLNTGVTAALNGTDMEFAFSGMLPGSEVSNCTATFTGYTDSLTRVNLTGSGIAASTGVATLRARLNLNDLSLTAIDTLLLSCGSGTAAPAYTPGISTGVATNPITATVTLTPVGGGNFPNMGAVDNGTDVPRYASSTASIGTVITFSATAGASPTTTMILPYVIGNGDAAPPAGTFDTGIVIANTTKNPPAFVTVLDGASAATEQAGSVTFTFMPQDASAPFTITPTTGFGLAAGVIPAGGAFIGNASEIMKAGGRTGSFIGHVFAVANFTNGHGQAFVYGGGAANRITSATEVLVIGSAGSQSRNAVGAIPAVRENTTR